MRPLLCLPWPHSGRSLSPDIWGPTLPGAHGRPGTSCVHERSPGFILRPSPDRCKCSPFSCRQGATNRQILHSPGPLLTPPVYRGSTPPKNRWELGPASGLSVDTSPPGLCEGQGSWAGGHSLLLEQNVCASRVFRPLFFRQCSLSHQNLKHVIYGS